VSGFEARIERTKQMEEWNEQRKPHHLEITPRLVMKSRHLSWTLKIRPRRDLTLLSHTRVQRNSSLNQVKYFLHTKLAPSL